ncbi:inner centromere protein A isoform X4 [Apis mellifera caucasica]|nr:inner centromere protein A isoform X4 [Apis mellifera caucasica]
MGGYAWVTLATNDAYSLGALVLAHSLRRVGTKYELAVLITPGVTQIMREKLLGIFSVVMEVNVLDSKDEANLALLARPELGITFTKLHCWRLIQYEKCVFLDADTLVVRNCDELFEREELSAAPDVGWPDCFNSGVFVYRPSQQTFASITAFAAAKGSFDGGDQGLLNMYFSDWARKDISKHLPFIYNMCSTATYSYLPAFKQFGDDVRIIHFIGITKPWLQYFDTLTGVVQPPMGSIHLQPLLQLWWNIFCEKVHSQLSPVMNNVLIKENIEQNENMNVTDKQTCTLISTSPHPDSKPCIDFHNVATQSDPHIMDDLNNSNAGLAGALAQMTLGEPRSSEQIALEEHMRKQSWEQGQIDYMGRDSFDNIWKKICETLALAPPRLPSPPKEIRKSVKNKIDETDEFIKSAETTQFIKSTDEVDKRTAQTSSHIEEQSLVNNVPITNVPKLLEDQKNEDDISRESQNDIFIDSPATNFSLQTSHEEITKHNTTELLNKISQQTSVPIVSSDLNQSSIGEQKIIISTKELENKLQQNKDLKIIIDIHQMNQLDIRDEKYAKELLTASQILPVSPVPIQVAESVLQMELKESMLDSQIISQEVVSSTIKPIHLTETENKIHINDSRFSIENKEKLNLDNTTNVKNIEGINKLSKLSIKPKETSQISLTVEQIQPQFVEIESTLSSNNFEIPEKLMQKQTEQQTKNEYCIKETMKLNEIGSEYETNKILNTPVRPLRIKELNSSPSTSIKEIRQFDSISQKKLIKKIVKKSTEKSVSVGELVEANDDDIEKKVIKKIVKKKKLKSEGLDDNIDSNSFNKQKKTLKIVKKGIKSSQRTSTDTIVPEIPTSSTSDLTPIPPKRKVKTAKSVIKKSDIE